MPKEEDFADSDSSYNRYVSAEWDKFHLESNRAAVALSATRHLTITNVLDIGCGAGQEMLPFVRGTDVTAIGIDYTEEVGKAGRRLYKAIGLAGRVTFVRGRAEELPCRSASFDVVICRLALPYTANQRALAEMRRVMRPGGVLLLRIHHARFYVDELTSALKRGNLRSAVHSTRVLVAGSWYVLTGRQPRNWLVGTETFQTEGLLRRELARLGLEPSPDHSSESTPAAPLFIITSSRTGSGGEPSSSER